MYVIPHSKNKLIHPKKVNLKLCNLFNYIMIKKLGIHTSNSLNKSDPIVDRLSIRMGSVCVSFSINICGISFRKINFHFSNLANLYSSPII